jgi:hypothetical protein
LEVGDHIDKGDIPVDSTEDVEAKGEATECSEAGGNEAMPNCKLYWDAEEGLDTSFIVVLWGGGGTFIDTFAEADVLDDIIALFEQDTDPESFDETEPGGGCFKELLPGGDLSLQEVDLLDEAEPGGGGFKELLLPGDLSLEEVDLLDTCLFDDFIEDEDLETFDEEEEPGGTFNKVLVLLEEADVFAEALLEAEPGGGTFKNFLAEDDLEDDDLETFVEAEPDGTLFNTVSPEEAEAFSVVLFLEAELAEGTFKDFLEEDDLFEASDFTGILLTDFKCFIGAWRGAAIATFSGIVVEAEFFDFFLKEDIAASA